MTPTSERAREISEQYGKTSKHSWGSQRESGRANWPQCDWECGNPPPTQEEIRAFLDEDAKTMPKPSGCLPYVSCAVAGITEFKEWMGSVKHLTGTGPQQFEYIGNQPLAPSNKKNG